MEITPITANDYDAFVIFSQLPETSGLKRLSVDNVPHMIHAVGAGWIYGFKATHINSNEMCGIILISNVGHVMVEFGASDPLAEMPLIAKVKNGGTFTATVWESHVQFGRSPRYKHYLALGFVEKKRIWVTTGMVVVEMTLK